LGLRSSTLQLRKVPYIIIIIIMSRSWDITTNKNQHYLLLPESFFPILSGCVTFGATLALSTAMQKFVGISTSTQVLPTINGVLSVCIASLSSERAAILTHKWQKNPQSFPNDVQTFQQHCLAITSNVYNNLINHHQTNHPLDWLGQKKNSRQQYQPPLTQQRSYDDHHQLNHDNNNDRRRNNHHSWIRVNKLPMHEIRMYVVQSIHTKQIP
jgi:hypothetical protein